MNGILQMAAGSGGIRWFPDTEHVLIYTQKGTSFTTHQPPSASRLRNGRLRGRGGGVGLFDILFQVSYCNLEDGVYAIPSCFAAFNGSLPIEKKHNPICFGKKYVSNSRL